MTLGSLFAVGNAAVAQTASGPTSAAAQPAVPEPQSGPETATPEATAATDTVERFPVLAITSVEILRSAHTPGLDIVAVNGVTSANGWSAATLVPLSRGVPADGVLDLVLVAQPPEESAASSTSYAPIQAILPLDAEHSFKAVRVRGATNTVLLKDFPGYVETKPPSEACNPCLGKYFVAKGSPAPAGVAASEIVREEALPAHARVLRPTDGIDDMRPNPNRVTILVGEDGRIIDVVWE
jgi:hypothetical protein